MKDAYDMLKKIEGLLPSLDDMKMMLLDEELEAIYDNYKYYVYPDAPPPKPEEIVKIDILTDAVYD